MASSFDHSRDHARGTEETILSQCSSLDAIGLLVIGSQGRKITNKDDDDGDDVDDDDEDDDDYHTY